MTSSLKILGPFLALLALGAIVTSGTQAAEEGPFFIVGAKPGLFTGQQIGSKHVFITSAGETECEQVGWDGGVASSPTRVATLRPGYSKCTLNKETATVEMNNCSFELTLKEGSDPPTATADLVCSGSPASITIKTANCTIHFESPQDELAHVQFSNTMIKADVDANFELRGMAYTATSGCPGSHAPQTDGEYKDEATVKADDINKDPVIFKVE